MGEERPARLKGSGGIDRLLNGRMRWRLLLIGICLAENKRRMDPYDHRLLRPFAVPALAALAYRFLRPKRRKTP